MDLSEMTTQQLVDKQAQTNDDRVNKKILQEIVNRKPMFVEYVSKLAKLLTNMKDPDQARDTFTHSLKINDTNIDIWFYYINWSIENDYILKKDEEKTKQIFEDARSKVGTHPRAWKIWRKYADFEMLRDKKNTTNLIYYSALCAELDDVDALIEDYTKFIDANFDKLKETITNENPPEFKNEKPNLLNHFLESNNDKSGFKTIITRLAEKAKEQVEKRAPYENSIQIIDYDLSNSTNPVLAAEKEHWNKYLEWQKGENDVPKSAMLYKRMLIPFFDDFSVWKDYIDFVLTFQNSVDECRELYKYLRLNPISEDKHVNIQIYLDNANFEEGQGQIKLAIKIHRLINTTLSPNYIKTISEYIKFEKRAGSTKNTLDFLEEALEKARKNGDEFATIFLTVNTCRFHFANDQDLDLLFDIFSDSVESFSNSKQLLINLIKLLETIQSSENKLYSRSFGIIEKAVLDQKTTFEFEDRKQIASSYLQWLKTSCKEQTYIELVQGKFVAAELVSQAAPDAVVQPINGDTSGQIPASAETVAHVGEKRTAEDPLDESQKRQKTDE